MIAPPRAPHTTHKHDELEALIKEARRRARRRRAAIAAVLLAVVAVGVFFALGGSGSSSPPAAGNGSGRPAARASEAEQIQRAARRATIVEAGITRGVGWAFFGNNGVVSVHFRDRHHHRQRVVIYTSRDRGTTWTAQPAPDAPDIRAYGWGMPGATPFSAVSGEAWVLLVGDALYSTSDGGHSWQLVHPTYAPPAPLVRDVHFSSPRRGWAIFDVGNGAALVQTTNGGRDWKPLSPPVPQPKPVHVKPQCGSACQRP